MTPEELTELRRLAKDTLGKVRMIPVTKDTRYAFNPDVEAFYAATADAETELPLAELARQAVEEEK